MKIAIICFFILLFIQSSKALELKGISLNKTIYQTVKFYTLKNNEDFSTTITYKGITKGKDKITKYIFIITENQNNKNMNTYKMILKNKDTLKINKTKFTFLTFRNEFIFLISKNVEKQ